MTQAVSGSGPPERAHHARLIALAARALPRADLGREVQNSPTEYAELCPTRSSTLQAIMGLHHKVSVDPSYFERNQYPLGTAVSSAHGVASPSPP